MAYNYTQLQASETVTSLLQYVDSSTNGLLPGAFLVAIFLIYLMIQKRYNFLDALLGASFVCSVLSYLMLFMKIINPFYVFVFVFITAGSIFLKFVIRD